VQLSDSELILLWQQGDKSAFEAIYKRYAFQLLAYTMRKTDDEGLSEEMVQDAFMVLYKQKEYAQRINSIGAYLCSILKKKILDHYKHEAVVKKYEEFVLAKPQETNRDTSNYLEVKELEQILNGEINKLPDQCRNVFKMSRHDQLSNKEIAKALNISENTVEQHIRKALRLLRTGLMNYDEQLFIISLIYLLK
jgi:RNA polymerase sigma-70 factor (family 1)